MFDADNEIDAGCVGAISSLSICGMYVLAQFSAGILYATARRYTYCGRGYYPCVQRSICYIAISFFLKILRFRLALICDSL